MKIIVAIDSLKGCLTSAEANAAARSGILASNEDAEVVEVPVSDGGEGWLEAFHSAVGGELVTARACDPLMRPIVGRYLVKDDLAVIEMAQVSGLMLLKREEMNPLKATTYGTGQLIVNAIRRGCRRFIVGLGGSATSDAGTGMLRALSEAFSADASLDGVLRLEGLHFTIAADVNNPLYGPDGAAYVFGRQKGASPEMVAELDRRAMDFAKESANRCGYDRSLSAGAGAAGGLGYAFMQYLNADCRSGTDLLLDAAGFDELLEGARLVVTGEGKADAQTLMGKLPQGILRRTLRRNVPTMLVAGSVADRQALLKAGFMRVECVTPPSMSLAEAMEKETAKENIRCLMERIGKDFRNVKVE